MKTLRLIGWIVGSLACVFIILASILLVSGSTLFGVVHAVNYIHVANSLLLVTIALFIASKQCCCCCQDKEDKKEK